MNQLDFKPYIKTQSDGHMAVDFVVEGIHCPACVQNVEKTILSLDNIHAARLNLSLRRLHVVWQQDADPQAALDALTKKGYTAHPFDPSQLDQSAEIEAKYLLRCFAVAAFASMNVMMLSVAVWVGAVTDITQETRDFFHWLSALIAIPAVAYAGRPFFHHAWTALSHGRTNMDVPISVGLILSLGLSIYQTFTHAPHAYYDAAVMLCAFLLAGRYLDQLMRQKTRSVAANLAALRVVDAEKREQNGHTVRVAVSSLNPNDVVMVRPGDRVPVDGEVIEGRSDIDQSLVTGETNPIVVGQGDKIYAGSLNGSGTLALRVLAAHDATFLAEVDRLLERAMSTRPATVLLADKVSRWYTPVVHITALATAGGWLLAGSSAEFAIVTAIAVLIITCPCALGLAVPAVHVVATGALFKANVLLNAGDALERMAEVDTLVFDKTGTLTLPFPTLIEPENIDATTLHLARQLAKSSRHPVARALSAGYEGQGAENAEEIPGEGISGTINGTLYHLGSAALTNTHDLFSMMGAKWPHASLIGFSGGGVRHVFAVEQALRPDAAEIIHTLKQQGLAIEILSGDRMSSVIAIAHQLSIETFKGEAKPDQKLHILENHKLAGKKIAMIGDGINDAPALAAAHVSISPVSAAEVTQATADAIFLGDRLLPIAQMLHVAKRARRIMHENLSLSVGYNIIFVPLAIAGYATPLIAAIAMAASSILVTANALRAGQLLSQNR